METTPQKLRSGQQNKSLHVYCTEVATELNNAGIGMKALIENLQIDHTKESVKTIWRAIAKAKYGKESTTELTSKEIQEVYEEFNRLLAQFGIHLAWPSIESSPNYLQSLELINQ